MQIALDELCLEKLAMRQRLHVLFEIHGKELVYQFEHIRACLHVHIDERDDVGMLQLSHHRDLLERLARHLVVLLELDLL